MSTANTTNTAATTTMNTDRVQRAAAVAAAALALLCIAALSFALADNGALPRSALFIGRFHPLIVHLPIGFLVVLGVGELVSRSPEPALGPVTRAILWGLLAASVAAFGAGSLLSHAGDYAPSLVASHRLLASAVVASSAALLVTATFGHRRAYRAALLAASLSVTLAADAGGRLTHGATWLTKYAPWSSEASDLGMVSGAAQATMPDAGVRVIATVGERERVAAENAVDAGPSPESDAGVRTCAPAPVTVTPREPPKSRAQATKAVPILDAGSGQGDSSIGGVSEPAPSLAPAGPAPAPRRAWDDVVAPILAVRCSGCHGAEKRKAKMRLDTFDGVMRGGEDGAVIVAGDPAKSLMMRRLLLPLDHEDHMPPAKKPQPTRAELDVLAWWIARGAGRDVPLDGLADETIAAAAKAIGDARRPLRDGADAGPTAH